MKLSPRYQPLVVLLIGLSLLIITALVGHGSGPSGYLAPIILILMGSSLSIVQLRCGFSLQYGGGVISRSEDPFSFWVGYFTSTLPFIIGGMTILLVR